MFIKQARTKIRGLVPITDPAFQRFQMAAFFKEARQSSDLQKLAFDPAANFYLDDWAVSAYEKFGLNENADGFERDELLQSHASFVDSWVCLDHNNFGPHLAVGTNIDAVYTPDDYVRVVMAVDRRKADRRHPGLEEKIASGQITDTSMGCLSLQSVCTIPKCANVATDESQFCDHVTRMRGQELCNTWTDHVPIKCGELNRGVNFFENSIITDDEGADCNAKIIAQLKHAAKTAMTGPKSIPAELFFRIAQGMAKEASPEQKAFLVKLVDYLESAL